MADTEKKGIGKMKKTALYSVVILLITLIVAALPTDAEADIYSDTLRLHILASSDSREDQELKLEIRDRLLKKYGDVLASGESIEGAIEITDSKTEEIERDCEEWIAELGYSYGVTVALKKEWYETRDYEDFTLPAGYYSSLRVVIGEGDGKNWWCVMYPPLCLDIATESAPADDGVIDYSDEELLLIKNKGYRVKFKILELLSEAFYKNS